MNDFHLIKHVLVQSLATLAFGLVCLAISAVILANAPAAEDLPGASGGAVVAQSET